MVQRSLNLRYFASLREALNVAEEDFEFSERIESVADLRQVLALRGGEWSRLVSVKNLRCAVNKNVASDSTVLHDGDEVAFFPPVTGG